MTDDTSAFIEYYHNKTSSNFAIAAAAVRRARRRRAHLGRQLLQPVRRGLRPQRHRDGNDFRTRWTSVGQRRSLYNTTTDQLVDGFRRLPRRDLEVGFRAELRPYLAVQPELRLHGLRRPGAGAWTVVPRSDHRRRHLRHGSRRRSRYGLHPAERVQHRRSADHRDVAAFESRPIYSTTYVQRGFEANASGELFDLPAGAAQLAFGAAWRREYQRSEVDYTAIARPDGTCSISQEACSTPLSGGFTVGELYGELFLPVLKDIAVREGPERDHRYAFLRLQQLRQHHQQQAAGGMASARRPAVPRHGRRSVPRAEHR